LLGPKYPGLTELHSQSSRFWHVRSYRAYRLKYTSQRYNQKVAGTLLSLAKNIRPSISKAIDGTDPISILTFLISFKRGCDHSGVSEGAAPYILAYFMEGAPKREMNTYKSRQKVSYCEAVHNLYSNYASEEILRNEYLKLQRLRQKTGKDERAFSRRILLHADRMRIIYTSRQVIEAYVEGILPTVRGLYSAHPVSLNSYEQVVALCEKLEVGRTPSQVTEIPRRTARKSLVTVPIRAAYKAEDLSDPEVEQIPHVSSITNYRPTDFYRNPSHHAGVWRQGRCFLCHDPNLLTTECPQLTEEQRQSTQKHRELSRKSSALLNRPLLFRGTVFFLAQ
jgi:hypothetical protein